MASRGSFFRRSLIACAFIGCQSFGVEEPPPEPPPEPVPDVPPREPGFDPSPRKGGITDGVPLPMEFALVTKTTFLKPVEVGTMNGRIYIAEQTGRLKYLSADGVTTPVALDIHDKVVANYQLGLVGFAFHPKFSENGDLFIAYSRAHPDGPGPNGFYNEGVIARIHSNDGGLTFDPSTEKELLVIEWRTPDHGIGKLAFGPDGFLYIGSGDGAETRQGVIAQDTSNVYGSILRIDVDNGDPYAIPPTNPFASGGGQPEIYAWGLRNPWRFSFDSKSGRLYAGDPGLDRWEELNDIVLGENYGWGILEGPECFENTTCDKTGLRLPLVAFDRKVEGTAAVIGGVFYYGTKVPALTGKYLFADYITGKFWTIPPDDPKPTATRIDEGLPRVGPTSFGFDLDGEIIFPDYTGKLYRIVPGSPPAP